MVLDKKLYGERDASVEFNEFVVSIYDEGGLSRCPQSPQFFYHPTTKVFAEVHQDDVHAAGPEDGLYKLMKMVDQKLKMKWSKLIGPGERYSFLKNNRLVLEYDTFTFPNEKYAVDVVVSLGLQDCKPVSTPIVKTRDPKDEEDPLTDAEQITLYRHCVSVARFLRNYRPDTNYAVKELSHGLQKPNEEDMKRLKHFARYLAGTMDTGI